MVGEPHTTTVLRGRHPLNAGDGIEGGVICWCSARHVPAYRRDTREHVSTVLAPHQVSARGHEMGGPSLESGAAARASICSTRISGTRSQHSAVQVALSRISHLYPRAS